MCPHWETRSPTCQPPSPCHSNSNPSHHYQAKSPPHLCWRELQSRPRETGPKSKTAVLDMRDLLPDNICPDEEIRHPLSVSSNCSDPTLQFPRAYVDILRHQLGMCLHYLYSYSNPSQAIISN